MVTTKLNLSMTEPQVRQIYAKQGDTGRVLDITLDQTPEDGTLRILRPDGVEVTSEAVTGGEVESGSTFESLTEADVTELTVGIEPVQDLNGYGKPWVGGAGKNKFAVNESVTSSSYITSASADTGIIGIADVSSPVWITPYIGYSDVESGKTYTISSTEVMPYCRVGGSTNTSTPRENNIPDTDIGADVRVALNYNSSSKTFTANASGRIYWFVCTDTHISAHQAFNLQVTVAEGASPSTWQPYSNICPITGHDEVRVYDDPVYGKTIKWNQLIKNGNFADASNWSWFSGMTVTVSGNVATVTTPERWNSIQQTFDWTYGHVMLATASVKKVGESGNVFVKVTNDFAYTNQQFAKAISTNDVWTDVVMCGKYTVTPEGSTSQIRFGVQEYRPSNSNNGFQIKNVGVFDLTEMFGEGNEPTIEEFEALFPKDYYPYNTGEETTVSAVNGDPNRQYTTSLGQTVYGGTLDMVTGVLTVDKAMRTYNGSEGWALQSINSYGIANFAVPLVYNQEAFLATGAITNRFEAQDTLISATKKAGFILGAGTTFYIRINSTIADTVATFKTWLASNPVSLVYPLASPQTYQLTAQQIKTLLGTNNVWASSGDIVSTKFTYGGLLSELPSEATEIVGKCYCDVEQNGVSSMPFTLNVKKNERAT